MEIIIWMSGSGMTATMIELIIRSKTSFSKHKPWPEFGTAPIMTVVLFVLNALYQTDLWVYLIKKQSSEQRPALLVCWKARMVPFFGKEEEKNRKKEWFQSIMSSRLPLISSKQLAEQEDSISSVSLVLKIQTNCHLMLKVLSSLWRPLNLRTAHVGDLSKAQVSEHRSYEVYILN